MANRLAAEKSPYLLQHKDNPVSWWAWGEEAFAKAKRENKPIFLSIGYSTCHWCHVMEHESFEDDSVAQTLNKNFISIKVDREERPDVDDIYMKAVQRLTGRGGWPMSVWLTPEGLPFYAGTYFPRPNFIALNERIADVWQNEREKIEHDANRISELILGRVSIKTESALDGNDLTAFTDLELSMFDPEHGGFSDAPKFPAAMTLMTLMRVAKSEFKAAEISLAVKTTLDKMARGGMYDHLAGGFHRYSTDRVWLVPHFEKMLYDNALLSLAYLEAYQFFHDEEYARVARETLDYLLREMTDSGGGFFSAQDADSLDPLSGKKEEGYFATYDYAELERELTNDELALLEKMYGVTPSGHYEGRNILNLQDGFTRADKDRAKSALEKLRVLRGARPKPHLDDKILVAWNGLAIAAFSFGYRVLRDSRYLSAAQRAASFILQKLFQGGKLLRRYRDGESRFNGYSEDYASLIFGLLHLYQADFDPRWLKTSEELFERLRADFWDGENGGLFRDDASDPLLIARLKDDYDGVTPTANSLAALSALWLERFTGKTEYRDLTLAIFRASSGAVKRWPGSMPMLLTALDFDLSDAKEVVIESGEKLTYETSELLQNFMTEFRPGLVMSLKSGSGMKIQVCRRGTCLLPASTWEEVEKNLRS